jgi:hypothetical protein
MKKSIIVLVGCLTVFHSHSDTLNNIDYSLNLVNNYVDHGQSMSDRNLSLQGEVSIENNDFTISAWGSTIDFQGAHLELNYKFEYKFKLNQFTNLDMGIIYYDYFGSSDSSDLTHKEFYYGIDYMDFEFKNYWSFDFMGTKATHTIIEAIYNYQIDYGNIKLSVDWSHSLEDDEFYYGNKDNYFHWSVGYETLIKDDIQLSISYDDSNFNQNFDIRNEFDRRVILSVGYDF